MGSLLRGVWGSMIGSFVKGNIEFYNIGSPFKGVAMLELLQSSSVKRGVNIDRR